HVSSQSFPAPAVHYFPTLLSSFLASAPSFRPPVSLPRVRALPLPDALPLLQDPVRPRAPPPPPPPRCPPRSPGANASVRPCPAGSAPAPPGAAPMPSPSSARPSPRHWPTSSAA